MSKWILNENNEKNPLIWGHKKNRRNVTKARKIKWSCRIQNFQINVL